jgi:hypothetical protein
VDVKLKKHNFAFLRTLLTFINLLHKVFHPEI